MFWRQSGKGSIFQLNFLMNCFLGLRGELKGRSEEWLADFVWSFYFRYLRDLLIFSIYSFFSLLLSLKMKLCSSKCFFKFTFSKISATYSSCVISKLLPPSEIGRGLSLGCFSGFSLEMKSRLLWAGEDIFILREICFSCTLS